MKRFLQLCFVFLLTATPAILSAAELYMWIDEKGVRNVSNTPPEKTANLIGKETYRRDSPEEIRAFEQKQKNYDRDLEERRRYNREKEASDNRYNASMERQKELTKQRELDRKQAAIDRTEDLNARKERLRAIENRDYDELRRLRLKDQQRQADRDINKYKANNNQ